MRILSFPARRLVTAAMTLGFFASLSSDASASPPLYDWPQFDGDPQHSGNNKREAILNASNVTSLTRTFQVTLPSVADSTPVVLAHVSTANGTQDLLFVTTKDGHALAYDAHTGAILWSFQAGPGTCKVNNGSTTCSTPSSPAVDPNRAYVYTYGLDGKAHKLAVATGAEVTTGGWPELVTAKAFDEQGASALAIATAKSGVSYLYVASSAYVGDGGDYQGHVTAINLSTGAQNVFNSLCSDQTVHFVETPGNPDCSARQSGIWARAGVVYHAALDTVFFATGNGNYAPASHQWGDSILSLHPDGTSGGTDPLDAYTPTDFSTIQGADLNLGSSAPAILPVPSTSKYQYLALQASKDNQLRLINLDNMSGQGGPGHTGGEVQSLSWGGVVASMPAVWNNPADGSAWAFVANGGGISGLRVNIDGSGNPTLAVVWTNASGGTSPVVANGVLYYASSGHLRALSPTTGTVLWDNTQIGSVHWQSPVVANGMVYVADQSGTLSAFGGVSAPQGVPALPLSHVLLLAVALLGGVAYAGTRREARATAARHNMRAACSAASS